MGYKSRGNFRVNVDICKGCKRVRKFCNCNVFITCLCGYKFSLKLQGEGEIKCPKCELKIYRKYDSKEQTYTLIYDYNFKR